MPKIKKGIPLLPVVMALILLNPLFSFTQPIVYAQTSASDYVVLAPLPCIESPAQTVTLSDGTTKNVPAITCKEGGNGSLQKTVSFQTYVQYTINLLIALSAVAAVFMIVWGGIEYMTSGSFGMKNDGKDKITNAIYGLILVLSSYLILRTIDPRLVEIPNTLVPQISLKPELIVDATGSLMAQIEKDAMEYHLDMANIHKDIDSANEKNNELIYNKSVLQSKILSLSESGLTNNDDAAGVCLNQSVLSNNFELDAACAQLANIDNQINQNKSDISYKTAKGIIESIAIQCSSPSDPACWAGKATEVAKVYTKYASGLSPEQSQELSAYGIYSQKKMQIEEQIALTYQKVTDYKTSYWYSAVSQHVYGSADTVDIAAQRKSSIENINKIVNDYEKSTYVDQTFLKELKNKQATAIENVKTVNYTDL